MARGSEVTIRWVPARHGVIGNEKADEYAREAARGIRPDSLTAVPDELRWETSLSHDKSRHRGPIAQDEPVDRGAPRKPQPQIQSPAGQGRQAQALSKGTKARRQPILPAALRPCGDRPIPQGQDPEDGQRPMLVVQGGESAPPLHGVQSLAASD